MTDNLSIVQRPPMEYSPIPSSIPRSIFSMTAEQFTRLELLAEMVSKSQLAYKKSGDSVLQKGDVFLIMLKGVELGMEPMAAMAAIDLILGMPTLDPQGMLALINRSGQVEDIQIEALDDKCTVMMKRKDRSPHTEVYSLVDAEKITFTEWKNNEKVTKKLTEKYNWKQMPRVMLKWRGVAACARVVFPDIIQGLYTPEELGADVMISEDGGMTIVPPEPPAKQQPSGQKASGNKPSEQPKPWHETHLADLLNLLKKDGYIEGDTPEVLGAAAKALLPEGKTFASYATGKEAGEVIRAAWKDKQPPAQPKNQQQPPDGWDKALRDGLLKWAWDSFARMDLEEQLGVTEDWEKSFADPAAARAAILMKALDGNWPVNVSQAKYNGKRVQFIAPFAAPLLLYGREEKFRPQVGEDYYNANKVGGWKAQAEPYTIGTLSIEWKPGKNGQYLEVVKATPQDGEEPEDVLDEFFTADGQPK